MKSKTDDIQEREDDACGMTLFFDNDVDIGSKNSAKRGQKSHSSRCHRGTKTTPEISSVDGGDEQKGDRKQSEKFKRDTLCTRTIDNPKIPNEKEREEKKKEKRRNRRRERREKK